MFAKINTGPKLMHPNRALMIGVTVFLAFTVTAGFVWMHSDQVIAPPGLRVLDWLWRVFICRCLG